MNFIQQILQRYLQQRFAPSQAFHAQNTSRQICEFETGKSFCFVFPNKRAGHFFIKELKKAYSALKAEDRFTFILPEIMDINTLFSSLTDRKPLEQIPLLFELYKAYTSSPQGVSRDELSFDKFMPKGISILSDFDEIDRYLVDPDKLFQNMSDLAGLKSDLQDILDESQLKAIRDFWHIQLEDEKKNLENGDKTNETHPLFQNFLREYPFLATVYHVFKKQLDTHPIKQEVHPIGKETEQWLPDENDTSTPSVTTQKSGYFGQIAREVIETLRRDPEKALSYTPSLRHHTRYIFVGLNGLSPVEKALLSWFRDSKDFESDFYFDYQSPWVYSKKFNPANAASTFVSEQAPGDKLSEKGFPSLYPLDIIEENQIKFPRITSYSLSSFIGQSQLITHLLNQGLKDKGENSRPDSIQNPQHHYTEEETAIIMPNQLLLLPLINALPYKLEQANITMGFPLSSTPISALINEIIRLIHDRQTEEGFYHENMTHLLNHPYIVTCLVIENMPEESTTPLSKEANDQLHQRIRLWLSKVNRTIIDQKQYFITWAQFKAQFIVPFEDDMPHYSLLEKIFNLSTTTQDKAPSNQDLADHLLTILNLLKTLLTRSMLQSNPALEKQEQEDQNPPAPNTLEERHGHYDYQYYDLQFVESYIDIIQQVTDQLNLFALEINELTFFKILKQSVFGARVPLEGNPIQGLQIMGMLESRCLNFKHLIIPSFNDGFMPRASNLKTLIPTNLRYGFGLPSIKEQETRDAYSFYRLLEGCEQLDILYDDRVQNVKSSGPSRYLLQLKYLYNIPIEEKTVLFNTAHPEATLDIKTDDTYKRLIKPFLLGQKKLSASSLKKYIQCPFHFFLESVLGFRETDELDDTLKSNTFGTIVHNTMQAIYEPYRHYKGEGSTLDKLWADYNLEGKGRSHKLENLLHRQFNRTYYKIMLEGDTTMMLEEREKNVIKTVRKLKKIEGYNSLIMDIIYDYVLTILKYDKKHRQNPHNFEYIASEDPLDVTLPILSEQGEEILDENGKPLSIKFTGSIDRIDSQDDIHLIDYKTGNDTTVFAKVEDVFDRPEKNLGAIFQTMLYAYLYMIEQGEALKQRSSIFIDIYKVKSMASSLKNPPMEEKSIDNQHVTLKGGSGKKKYHEPLIFSPQYFKDKAQEKAQGTANFTASLEYGFESKLHEMLRKIFIEGDFPQAKESDNVCTYCPFISVCDRHPKNNY